MYTLYCRRNDTMTTYIIDDLRTGCIMGYNSVTYLGSDSAYIIDSETGELLRYYESR